MERQFNGIWIPNFVWYSKYLKTNEKMILGIIYTMQGTSITNAEIAKFMNLSIRRTRQIIKKLKDKNIVTVIVVRNELTKEVEERFIDINEVKEWQLYE